MRQSTPQEHTFLLQLSTKLPAVRLKLVQWTINMENSQVAPDSTIVVSRRWPCQALVSHHLPVVRAMAAQG